MIFHKPDNYLIATIILFENKNSNPSFFPQIVSTLVYQTSAFLDVDK